MLYQIGCGSHLVMFHVILCKLKVSSHPNVGGEVISSIAFQSLQHHSIIEMEQHRADIEVDLVTYWTTFYQNFSPRHH